MSPLFEKATLDQSPEVDSFNGYKPQDIIALFLESANKYSYPLAAWSLPDEETKHVILDLSGKTKYLDPDLETMSPGFVYSPFDADYNNSDHKVGYVSADLYYNSSAREIVINERKSDLSEKAEVLGNKMLQRLKRGFNSSQPIFNTDKSYDPSQVSSKGSFTDLVKRVVGAIENKQFKKVVPSRCQFFPMKDDINLVASFNKLCDKYPKAFVSLIVIPEIGVWLGASPEILVSTHTYEGSSTFSTVALAGTQKQDDQTNIKNAAWRMKEIEEQAMVSRYIVNCFKKIRLRDFEEDGPKTVTAGNLLHLRTDFTVDMEKTNFSELGSVMLKLLHPTSAVCGLPKQPAMDFIQRFEAYSRELYSGFIGPVNFSGRVDIFVNLRCLQLLKGGAMLYAGAGVTADSNPENEWLETQMKMETLLKVLSAR